MGKKVVLAIGLLILLVLLIPIGMRNISFMPMTRVQEGDISILLPKTWFRADLRRFVPEMLEMDPSLKEQYKLGLTEIKLRAGDTKGTTILVTRNKGNVGSLESLTRSFEISVKEVEGKITSARQISKDKFEIIVSFKEHNLKILYFCYQQEKDIYWEFYFTAPAKQFLFQQGSLRKIFQSFKTFPQQKIIPTIEGAMPA